MEVDLDSRIIAGGIIVAISLIGLYRVLSHRSDITKQLGFAEEYLSQLGKYAESGGKDETAYEWMTRHSNKMQNDLGHQGIFASYKPPGANYLLKNVPIILNLLPQLHTLANDEWLGGRPVTADVYTTIGDALLRHIGTQEALINQLGRAIRNPLTLFRHGIEAILLMPFYLLQSFGLLSDSTGQRVHGSKLAKIFSGIVALISFLSGLITIFMGWEVFSNIIIEKFLR